jgi:predicted nucleic acid-binding protein
MPKKVKPPGVKRLYWDACIFLDYIDEVPDRMGVLDALLEQCEAGNVEIWTSQLSITEVAFAAVEKKDQELDPSILAKIDKLWHPESPITLVEIHEVILRKAREILRTSASHGRSGLRSADVIHVATALHHGIPTFHTRDDRMTKLDQFDGLTVVVPSAKGIIVWDGSEARKDG